jgi:bilirubin oxidase
MRFDVVSSAGAAFAPASQIAAAAAAAAPPVPRSQGTPQVRKVSLNELASKVHDGPAEARLGTVRADGSGRPLMFADDVTERPRAGVTEIWEIHNFTEDAHPIHLHQTQFEIVDRRAPGLPVTPAQPYERGPKDTAVVLPSPDAEKGPAITRLRATFDLRGRYVWHCHILEHEDNEMMRPLVVR